jgi:peptidoglycan-associated lipoprotein
LKGIKEDKMKKALFAMLILFIGALLMGGTCGGPQEVPVEEPPVVEEPVVDTMPTEPVVEEPPAPEPLKSGDFEKAYFDFDKYNIRPDARTALEYNAEVLKRYPEAKILIEGHCDERGTVEYNIALGERRAKAVKDYLVNLGINAARMRTISYGKERPVDLGHNEVAWQKNRRAEFKID